MKVKQLIRELKKMPQNSEVGVVMHDNDEWEVAGWASYIYELVKNEHDPIFMNEYDEEEFKDTPDCVVICC